MKHTPGPWGTGTGYGTAKNHAVVKNAHIIAKVNGHGYPAGRGWAPESEANARLIAAAPELLDALTDLVGGCGKEGDLFSSEAMQKAKAAIAKAEGA